jgi:predicted acetyltransferase
MSNIRNDKINDAKLVIINDENYEIFTNLSHSYEAEFSNLTHKMPNEKGIFESDTLPTIPYLGYLLYKGTIPVGFCIVEINKEINDIAEFYVIPSMRRNHLGYGLAATIFRLHPGKWQVRQIEGADNAKTFWRKVINKFSESKYTEAIVDDPDWGVVTRQQFSTVVGKASALPLLSIFPTVNIPTETIDGNTSRPENTF